MVKAKTSLPLCVGFGISTPEQAQKMLAIGADGVITGSHIIKLIQESAASKRCDAVRHYVEEMCLTKLSCTGG